MRHAVFTGGVTEIARLGSRHMRQALRGRFVPSEPRSKLTVEAARFASGQVHAGRVTCCVTWEFPEVSVTLEAFC